MTDEATDTRDVPDRDAYDINPNTVRKAQQDAAAQDVAHGHINADTIRQAREDAAARDLESPDAVRAALAAAAAEDDGDDPLAEDPTGVTAAIAERRRSTPQWIPVVAEAEPVDSPLVIELQQLEAQTRAGLMQERTKNLQGQMAAREVWRLAVLHAAGEAVERVPTAEEVRRCADWLGFGSGDLVAHAQTIKGLRHLQRPENTVRGATDQVNAARNAVIAKDVELLAALQAAQDAMREHQRNAWAAVEAASQHLSDCHHRFPRQRAQLAARLRELGIELSIALEDE